MKYSHFTARTVTILEMSDSKTAFIIITEYVHYIRFYCPACILRVKSFFDIFHIFSDGIERLWSHKKTDVQVHCFRLAAFCCRNETNEQTTLLILRWMKIRSAVNRCLLVSALSGILRSK